MRLMMTFGLVFILSVGAFAQTTTTPAAAPVTVYEQTYRVLDSVGNLVVFDFGYSYSPATVRGHDVRGPKDPKTRITIVRPAGSPETVEYAGTFTVVGVGARAVYVMAPIFATIGATTTATYKLVALNPQVTLPATVAASTGIALPTGKFDVDMGQPDLISILTEAGKSITTSGTTTTKTTSPRTVKVVRFNGTSFDTVSTATLP